MTSQFAPVPFRPKESGIDAYSFNDFLNLPSRVSANDIIASDVLPAQGRLAILGLKGVGKTLVSTQLAFEVASASPAIGVWQIPRPCKVLMIQKELQDEKYKERLEACGRQYVGLNSYLLVIVPREQSELIMLDTPDGRRRLEQAIIFYQPEVVFLDPFRNFHNLDENQSVLIKPLLAFLTAMTVKYNVAFVVSNHTKTPLTNMKTGSRFKQDMYDQVGSKVFIEWADTVFTLNTDKPGSGRVLLDPFMRHGKEDPDPVLLTLNRTYATFDGEVQGHPTTDAEWKVSSIMQKHGDEMLYDDLVATLVKQQVGPRVAVLAISLMLRTNQLYYVGNWNGTANRLVRMLSSQSRSWFR